MIDWSEGILACNAACGVKLLDHPTNVRVEATLMQAGMPAVQ